MKLKFFIAVVLVLGSGVFGPVRAQEPLGAPQPFYFNKLTVEDGLSQNSVVGIARDSTGYLWLATLNGLNRFSGKNMVHYPKQFDYTIHPDFSKPGGIYVDRQGRLWIITDGNLERYREETDDFISIPSFEQVTEIFQTDNFDLYIGTYGHGTYKIDARTKDTLRLPMPENKYKAVLDFHGFDHGLWMACTGAVLVYDPNSDTVREVPVQAETDPEFSALEHSPDGTLWLGTLGHGLFYKSPESGEFLPFRHRDLPDNLIISDLMLDRGGRLWITTYGHGAYLFDPQGGNAINFKKQNESSFALQHNDLPMVYEDDKEVVWIGSDGMGAFYYDPYLFKFNVLTNTQIPDGIDVDMVRCITTDPEQNIWIGTSGNGLTKVDLKAGTYHTYTAKNSPLRGNRVVSLMHDGKDLWIGYAGQGLSIMGPSGNHLEFPEVSDFGIYGIVKTSHTQAWLCTERHGLVLFDRDRGIVERFNTQNSKLTTNTVRVIEKENDSIWWIGTEENGLFRLSLSTREIKPIKQIPGTIKSLYFNQGDLWVGTGGDGLIRYGATTGEIRRFSTQQGLPDKVVYGILPHGDHKLWLSSNQGLTQFDTQEYSFTNHRDQISLQFNEFNTGAHYKDGKGILYFGGVKGINWFDPDWIKTNPYRPKTIITNIKVFDATREPRDEIPLKHTQNTITFTFSSLEFSQPGLNQYKYRLTGHGDQWVHAGNNNEVRYTNLAPGSYRFQVLSSNYDGLWGEVPATYEFEIEQPWHFTNMAVAVFTTFIFQGSFIAIGLFMLLLYFRLRRTDYLLYGIYSLLFACYFFLRIDLELRTGLFWEDPDSIYYFLTPIIFLVTGIFVAFVNSFAEIQRYHAKFSREIAGFALITYAMAAASLLFLLATKEFSLVKDHLNLVLMPLHLYSIYAVIRAFIVVKSPLRYYILLGNIFLIGFSMVGVYYGSKNAFSGGAEANNILGFYSFNISQLGVFLEMIVFSMGLGHKFYLVEMEKDKIQRTDELKTKLYTDISHEIRTPLTLITGPIEHQLTRPGLSPQDGKELSLIKDNAQRLLGLMDQMMDLSMIDSGQLKLKIVQDDLRGLLVPLVESFTYLAKARGIEINYDFKELDPAWFDRDVVEKTISNLLSNAVKYAPMDSEVLVKAEKDRDHLVFSVVNDTRDMERADLEKLFKRFHQNDENSEGVGVGLALVRELVSLSEGSVVANRMGSDKIQFLLNLPIGRPEQEMQGQGEPTVQKAGVPPEARTGDRGNSPSLLIVEDRQEVRSYIASIFGDRYKILTAKNGKQGIETAMDQLPDLIISDVMMPLMNGIQLCKTIKEHQLTSHIPVILLSAKAEVESQLRGLQTGADAYVTKPFNPEMLSTRVEKLLENRVRLREHYAKTFKIDPGLVPVKTEQEFLQRLQNVLDQHILDPTFTGEKFAKLMLMSRSQLHNKLHAISGRSTTEFVRTQRINLAKDLLVKSDAPISEIAYQVGFNSPSYFNKCFRETQGLTPNEYRFKER